MNDSSPRVSIGLPTYNRPEFLKLVLECFRRQTFSDFELIISDNASQDPDVQKLCERYALQDSRFRYVRQPINHGPERNFRFVYDQSRAPLFMWASDDDLWPSNFLEKGLAALDGNPLASAWFCQVVNINAHGDVIRRYPSFRRFQSTALKPADLIRFLWEPEIMGKANLIYSIFRRETLAEVIDLFLRERPSSWGSDMNLVYGYLCRSNIVVDDQLMLQKRVPVESIDQVTKPRLHIYPREDRALYFRNYRRAAAGTSFWLLTATTLVVRAVYDYWVSGRATRDFMEWPLGRRIYRVLGKIWARIGTLASARKE